MKIIENIKDWWNIYRHLKKGEHFSRKEKRIILKMIKLSRIEYTEDHRIYRGLCHALEDYEFRLTHDYTNYLTSKLSLLYHNPLYYEYQGLKCRKEVLTNPIGYWWDRKDRESRLKALDILEYAIIND